jgi:hypothetical protein
MFDLKTVNRFLPGRYRDRIDEAVETLSLLREIRDPRVLLSLGPSGVRGLVWKRGKQGVPSKVQASHSAHFDFTYPADHPEMQVLYQRAKQGQWDADMLPWQISVDPENHEVPLIPEDFIGWDDLHTAGIHLSEKEKQRLLYSVTAWMLSQFLHGEQGALFAAAQVTEAVQFFDGKLYGATQVMDEGRHVEVFHRYLTQKLGKLYQVNDNLFVIIDALMADSRWDLKFLGMQIMVEGLALGAFGVVYKLTKEPLLKQLLKMVIQDEARHVHYGVLALRDHIKNELSESERQEREDWALEVALLMRNRFMAYEVFEEWAEGTMSREQWRQMVSRAPGMVQFRRVMFSRLIPNLREIGLMSPRILPRYEQAGLMQYFTGLAADKLSGEDLVRSLDSN